MSKETFKIEIPVSVTDNTDPGVSQSKSKMSAFDKVVEKAQDRLDKMNSTKWKVAIETVDKVTGVVSSIGTSVKNITGKVWSVTLSAVDKVTSVAKGIISTLGEVLSIGTMVSTVLGGLTIADALEAAQTQTTVEAQLNNVLQNMADSAAEAETIFDRLTEKASALQQATMYGDEAYIAGAAELATYFTDADALELMMDTLADYAAGMSGGAELSTEEMVDYATNLGKIMTGAYDAMTKKGFAFTDAQKAVIEGTATQSQLVEALGSDYASMSEEMQAAQVIADIINESWEGLAETMAELPSAKVTKFKNAWGDVKEAIGGKLYPAVGDFFEMLSDKLPAVQELLESGADWLAEAFENLIPSISSGIDTALEKINELAKTIKEMVNSDEWQGAGLFGKVKIAWNTLIAEPFSEWWNSTGKEWFAEKAASIGEAIGSGITSGLLALLGIDISGAASDGVSIGGAFLDGFKEGFDTEEITQALKDWASNNKEVVIAIGGVVGFNLITGLASKINSITSLFSRSKSGSSTAGTAAMTVTSTTTTVNGSVVNVYGTITSSASSAASAVSTAAKAGSSLLSLGSGTGSTVAALGSGTGTAAGTAAEYTVLGNGATLLGTGGALTSGLATIGTTLGSSATTLTGAAVAGGASVGGIAAGLAGLVSAGIDVYQGHKASEEGDSKTAKDEYVTAGTKAGMVATGAGVGAAIGSVVPGLGTAVGALVGAGVGGIGALLGGNAAGKAISDGTDEGGWLSNIGSAIGGFFTDTIPAWIGNIGSVLSTFFTETIPEKWGEFWDGVGDFFTETVPYALGYAVGAVQTFFTEDVPEFFTNLWGGIVTFFTGTLPNWISDTWNNHIVPFFTEDIPEFFTNLWDSLATFFTETIPNWVSDTWSNHIVPFFTEDIPNFFTNLWDTLVTFFTETIPNWASNTWNNHIVPFFTESIPGFFSDVWDSVTGFFTEALPTLASNIWSAISGWFSGIGDWIGNVWDKITGSFSSGYSDATGHAWGGIMSSPHVGLVAEDGPEAIIPLSPSKSDRGMDLWMRAGQMLGVQPYAEGDIVGETAVPTETFSEGGGGGTFEINIEMNPEFRIESNDAEEESIVAVIRAHIREMADDLSDEMADRLARVFANMPLKGSV